MVTVTITGRGTTEVEWTGWLDERSWPLLDLAAVSGRRVCVLAAHPDDEVLGAAELISQLAARGQEIVAVWASDGEASHPDSKACSQRELGSIRRAESRAALARLGVRPSATHHFGFPDGGLTAHLDDLARELSHLTDPDDLVITPWAGDGHPDHEAIARAAEGLGAVRWQYPIWMWHWAIPGDDRVPWERMHVAELDDVALKAAAIEEFASQVRPIGSAPEDAAILPRHVVARFLRRFEWFVV
jgi:LmbE family N-acetylglucosaminyl deacetylase